MCHIKQSPYITANLTDRVTSPTEVRLLEPDRPWSQGQLDLSPNQPNL